MKRWTRDNCQQHQDNGCISGERPTKEIDEGKDQQSTAQEKVIVSKPAVSKNDVLVSERTVKCVDNAESTQLWPTLEMFRG